MEALRKAAHSMTNYLFVALFRAFFVFLWAEVDGRSASGSTLGRSRRFAVSMSHDGADLESNFGLRNFCQPWCLHERRWRSRRQPKLRRCGFQGKFAKEETGNLLKQRGESAARRPVSNWIASPKSGDCPPLFGRETFAACASPKDCS